MPSGTRQQAIVLSNIDQDLRCQLASLGHNELTHCGLEIPFNLLYVSLYLGDL